MIIIRLFVRFYYNVLYLNKANGKGGDKARLAHLERPTDQKRAKNILEVSVH